MLDLDPRRTGGTARDAATLVVVRDAPATPGASPHVEVFCVERHKASRFLGGAIVFPGGKVDAADADAAWSDRVTAPRAEGRAFAASDDALRALAIAACREALEEAAILPFAPGAATATHADLLAMRAATAAGTATLRSLVEARGLKVDLAALHPLSRWITPTAEARRFDARFFLVAAPPGQTGAHDEHETMASFWGAPAEILARFDRSEVALAPPTHRTLEVLAAARSTADAIAIAARASLEPICPEVIRQVDARGESLALVLPGDPAHSVKELRVAGKTRYVERAGRFLPEDPPR